MRLLIWIAQATLDGLEDKDDWKKAPGKLPKAIEKYFENFEKWKDLFEQLHSKKPFLQFAELKSG